MSGIGSCHNKFETCKDCPDRSIDPNCHDSCKGYLYRAAENEKRRAAQREDSEFIATKWELMRKAKKHPSTRVFLRK